MTHSIRRFTVLMLVLVVSALAPSRGAAVTVSVTPPDTTVLVGSTFSLRIETGAFADLKAFQMIFMFDPAKIQFLGAGAGDVLTSSGNPYSLFVLPDYVAPADTAWTDCAMLVGSSSGPGILNFFNFKALVVGDSPVQCQLVDFRDSNNAQTLPACTSGIVRVVGPVPVRVTSWGRIKIRYR